MDALLADLEMLLQTALDEDARAKMEQFEHMQAGLRAEDRHVEGLEQACVGVVCPVCGGGMRGGDGGFVCVCGVRVHGEEEGVRRELDCFYGRHAMCGGCVRFEQGGEGLCGFCAGCGERTRVL